MSRHITAAEVQHKQELRREREREKEIECEREREQKSQSKNTQRERERELGIFSMMGFESASSSFLALLVIKPNRKTD